MWQCSVWRKKSKWNGEGKKWGRPLSCVGVRGARRRKKEKRNEERRWGDDHPKKWEQKMKRKSEHERRENWEEIREEGYRSHMRVMGMREKEWVGWLGR